MITSIQGESLLSAQCPPKYCKEDISTFRVSQGAFRFKAHLEASNGLKSKSERK